MSLWSRVKRFVSQEPKGTFNYGTGEIDIREDLEGRERKAVVAHEEGHQAFNSRAPWWPRFVLEGSALLVTGAIISVGLSVLGFESREWALRFMGALIILQFLEEAAVGLYALRRVPCRWTVRYLVKVGFLLALGLVSIVTGWSW